MKTRAAVAFSAAEPLRVVELELRDPRPGEVLLKMAATGICHTDIAVLDGEASGLGRFPLVLGHEGAGIVTGVGTGVSSVRIGDPVILTPVPQCGVCPECLSGRSNLCEELFAGFAGSDPPFSYEGTPVHKFMHAGTFTEFMVAKECAVAKVRNDAPLEKACLAACSVATGVGAAAFAAKIVPGATVVVFGMGGIGLNAVQGARLCNASRIIAVDTNSEKEGSARQFGATDFLNPRLLKGEVTERIRELTGGGADYSIEAVGHPEVVRQALACLRTGSGTCIVVGMMRDGAKLTLDPADLGIGRTLRVSAGGDLRGRSDPPKLIDWYMSGKLMFDQLITEVYRLDDINTAIAEQRAGRAIRNVIGF